MKDEFQGALTKYTSPFATAPDNPLALTSLDPEAGTPKKLNPLK